MANRKAKKKTRTSRKKTLTKPAATVKKTASRKTAKKKPLSRRMAAKKKPLSRRVAAKKKPALKQAKAKTKKTSKKVAAGKRSASAGRLRGETPILEAEPFELERRRSWSAGQSGDLQGLSGAEDADSESVDELVEEGNAFEAGVVAGVESAANPREVRTHEVLEDDVPSEYLDEE